MFQIFNNDTIDIRKSIHVYAGNVEQCRRFLDGVLYVLRSGSQWGLLVEIRQLERYLQTVVRAHACVAGAKKQCRKGDGEQRL